MTCRHPQQRGARLRRRIQCRQERPEVLFGQADRFTLPNHLLGCLHRPRQHELGQGHACIAGGTVQQCPGLQRMFRRRSLLTAWLMARLYCTRLGDCAPIDHPLPGTVHGPISRSWRLRWTCDFSPRDPFGITARGFLFSAQRTEAGRREAHASSALSQSPTSKAPPPEGTFESPCCESSPATISTIEAPPPL